MTARPTTSRRATSRNTSSGLRPVLLFAPMGLLMACFAVSVLGLLAGSVSGSGLQAFIDILGDPIQLLVLWRTVWISVLATALCALLGFPLALFLARSRRRNLWLILVISPWLVSIVVRTYGWMVLLGTRGVINTALRDLGLIGPPLRVLYTPGAVVIGLTHVLLPFMVIAILSALLQQDRRLEEASRILGGTRWQTFTRVTLPLAVPGVIGGACLVLLIATGSIVTPLLLGGLRDRMLGTQIYTEIFQVYDFERATAMAVLLLALALILVAPLRVLEGRARRAMAGS